MGQEKEYFAFISYQRKDENWAEWLRRKLEHYRFPLSIRKHNKLLPKEIRPVFRDVLELAGGVLSEEIQEALGQSKYLIVICSPNSAKSPWVNKEVQSFIGTGRPRRIIPFIVDGIPNSGNSDTECFTSALSTLKDDEEILGININEMGRDAAVVKVVARMFGLKFDTLWQRHERERIKRRAAILGSIVLFALVSLGIGAYIARQNRLLDAINREVIEERDRANSERDRANSERDRANSERDRANEESKRAQAANAELIIVNDSILRQNLLINSQKDEIAREKEQVEKASYETHVSLSRLLAEKSLKTLANGDSYVARLIALQALPPNLAYTTEAEFALRSADQSNSMIIRIPEDYAYDAVFSKEGKTIMTPLGNGDVLCWDALTGQQIDSPIDTNQYFFSRKVFSPDRRMTLEEFEDLGKGVFDLILKDARTGAQIGSPLRGHTSLITSASFSPDGEKVVSSSFDNSIRIWDARTGKQVGKPLLGHTNVVRMAVFSPDGRCIASASDDKTIRIWDTRSGKETISPISGHPESVRSIDFSPDGKYLVSASDDNSIRVWDVLTGQQAYNHTFTSRKYPKAIFSNDGKYIIVFLERGKEILLLDFNKDKQLGRVLGEHNRWVDYAAVSPDGKNVVSSTFREIRIWDFNTGNPVGKPIEEQNDDAHCVVFSPNSKYLVTSAIGEWTAKIWEVQTGKRVFNVLRGHSKGISSVDISPDGKSILTSSFDGTIRIWNLTTGLETKRMTEGVGVYSAVFSPNGSSIAAVTSSSVNIWDLSSGEKVLSLPGVRQKYAIYSPDGTLLACVSDDPRVTLWNLSEPKPSFKSLSGHRDWVKDASFSPDGKILATASADHTIRLWDVASGLQVAPPLEGHMNDVSSVSFTPDGEHIVSSSRDYTVRIWDYSDLQEVINKNRERFRTRQLSSEERKEYLGK